MTIAIGILAAGGVVLAADSQETVTGYWKRDESKINGIHGGDKAILVCASGNASYCDALSEIVVDRFGDGKDKNTDEAKASIQMALDEFYKKRVSIFQDAESLSVDLLIGCAFRGQPPSLWKAYRNTLADCSFYGAIGVGTGHALPLLASNDLLMSEMKPEIFGSVGLAAYVIYQTKRSVDGCGNYTDVGWTDTNLSADNDLQNGYLDRDGTRELDEVFRRYVEDYEPAILRQLMGGRMTIEMQNYAALASAKASIADILTKHCMVF